jgi:hypothetical protein
VQDADPFSFGAAIDHMIATDTVDPLLISDDLEGDDLPDEFT